MVKLEILQVGERILNLSVLSYGRFRRAQRVVKAVKNIAASSVTTVTAQPYNYTEISVLGQPLMICKYPILQFLLTPACF